MVGSPNPVSRIVWPREGRSEPADRGLRRAALLQATVLGLVGLGLQRVWHRPALAGFVWALAAVALLTGLLRPAWYRPLHRFAAFLGGAVGTLLTWLLLTPVYVIGFGLAALWLRLRGADPMQQRRLPTGCSYWIRRRRDTTADDATRQFRVEDPGARAERRPLDGGGAPT